MTGLIALMATLGAIGVPLFVLVGAIAAGCLLWLTPDHRTFTSFLPLVQNAEQLLGRQEFLAIPLFTAAGAVMTAGGIATRLVAVARAAVGWLPGGLAVAAVLASMFFAAISGSSPVTLIAVGSILFPAMLAAGYPEPFALGLVTTAGSLGCLVPPSLAMLIYAVSVASTSARVSPQDLFLAGLVPALLVAGLLAAYAVWTGRRIPKQNQADRRFDPAALRVALREGAWALALPVLVLGGIYGGLFTPSEAGVVATLYALFVTTVVHRDLSWRRLAAALLEAGTLLGALLVVLILAFGLNDFLALMHVQDRLLVLIRQWHLGPAGFLLVVNAALVGIGALTDSISCTLLFAPVLAPLACRLYGFDPLHFAVIFVVNMEIGYLMPPVATNLFVAAAVFGKPFGQVARAVVPTLVLTCLALVVLMFVPTLAKGAVNWQRGVAIVEAFPWQPRPMPAGDADVPDLARLTAAALQAEATATAP